MRDIFVDAIPEEKRMVFLDKGQLEHLIIERAGEEQIVNRIYKGIIRNILPGMEAAFIDIGIGRNAYLKIEKPIMERYGKKLFVGQHLMVQVVKEEMLGKAARVTGDVSLAGTYMVLLPKSKGIRISKQLRDGTFRSQLKERLEDIVKGQWGIIIRTAAKNASMEELERDLHYLVTTYEQMNKRYNVAKGPRELYRDADFWLRLVRDYAPKQVNHIYVDHKEGYERLMELLPEDDRQKVLFYDKKEPLFTAFDIEEKIEEVTRGQVPLPSGGELQIDRTEALTVIDVNSKHYTGYSSNVSDTAFVVNKEAAREVCRQLRLRHIGGIILVDFMDMYEEAQKEELMNILRQECRKDPVKTVLCGITSLGLVEMTRKREKQGIEEVLTDSCSSCGGTGYLLSAQTIYITIVRHLMTLYRMDKLKNDVLVQVHPQVYQLITKVMTKELSQRIHKKLAFEEKDFDNREAYAILAL